MSTRLLELLSGPGVVLMDGAMGTRLLAQGLTPGVPPDVWNLLRPAEVLAVHRSWTEAGARMLVTNTFSCHAERFEAAGRTEDLARVVREAVRLAREAAGSTAVVLGDVGPAGPPHTAADPARRVAAYRELIGRLFAEGVDGLLIESMRDPVELEAALQAASAESGGRPVLASGIFLDPDHEDQLEPGMLGRLALAHGAAAVGANCTELPGPLATAVRGLRATGLPLFARAGILPTAATPPPLWATQAATLPALGVRVIGGCCGTTPAHLAELARALERAGMSLAG